MKPETQSAEDKDQLAEGKGQRAEGKAQRADGGGQGAANLIFANGEPHQVTLPMTVAEFLEQRGLKSGQVVVELNGKVLARSDMSAVGLGEGDRLEIIVPVAGG